MVGLPRNPNKASLRNASAIILNIMFIVRITTSLMAMASAARGEEQHWTLEDAVRSLLSLFLYTIVAAPLPEEVEMDASTLSFVYSTGGGFQSGVHHALNPDPYRGVFSSDGVKYANDVQDIIDYGTCGRVAGFIAEPIQGVGGVIELAPAYLPAVHSIIKKAGGLFIADEVETGFGRTSSHFWGFEAHGIVPDIVTLAKGIGNGAPIGAVVTTPQIAEVLTRRTFFSTFGGNPVCAAAGHTVLRVIEKEKLDQNAFVVGSYLKECLSSLMNKHEIIGDVRGRGMLLGVEFVKDQKLKIPAKSELLHIIEKMKDMGVLVGIGGFHGNVLRITPPLCFTKEDADFLVDVMDYTMSKM